MKVNFLYVPVTGGGTITPTPALALGSKLSPLNQSFNHAGVPQAVHYPRAAAMSFFGRGGANVSETFTAQADHASYWAAVVYTRVKLGALMGTKGTLRFDADDGGGSIQLIGCVCTKASGRLIGLLSLVDFEFVGGVWS
jgi:hypothetical protein